MYILIGREIISWLKNAFSFREVKCYEQNKAELTARDARGTGLLFHRGSWGEGGGVKGRMQGRASQAAGRQLGVPSWEWVWRHEGTSSVGRWTKKEEHTQPDTSFAGEQMRAPNHISEYLKVIHQPVLMAWPAFPPHDPFCLWPDLEPVSLIESADERRLIRGEVEAAPGLLRDQAHLGPSKADLAQLPSDKIGQAFLAIFLTWSF